MKKLPVLRWKSASDAQRKSLARWLREREFQLAARSKREPRPVARTGPREPSPFDNMVAPFDSEAICPGEIRLLSSWLLPGADRPVYVAVLSDWDDGLKLIAPFGPLGEPATAGELRTEREAPALAVLCLWTAHTAQEELLLRSWLVDSMSGKELADAWSIFQHTATGRPPHGSLAKRVGLPILDENDPRIAYQREEAAMLVPLVHAVLAANAPKPENLVELPNLRTAAERYVLFFADALFAKAVAWLPDFVLTSDRKLFVAESKYNREIFDVPGRQLSIRFDLKADFATTLRLTQPRVSVFVYDVTGEPAPDLNSAVIVDHWGSVLATISDSVASLPLP